MKKLPSCFGYFFMPHIDASGLEAALRPAAAYFYSKQDGTAAAISNGFKELTQ